MRSTLIRSGVVAVSLLVLAGCGSSTTGNSSAAPSAAAGSSSAAANAVLATSSGPLGRIVVGPKGRTVYVFDKDAPGTSNCSGACAGLWPAVTADTAAPTVDGVTGDVGTITRADGTRQVTLGGRPLYTYAGDSNAGDVTGQGVQNVWWVVAADGTKIKAAPSTASSSAPTVVPGY